MWKNAVEAERPQMTIWCMHFACWTPKAAVTHLEYVMHIVSSPTMVAQTRVSVMLYIHCLSCLCYIHSSAFWQSEWSIQYMDCIWNSFWRDTFIYKEF